MEIRITGIPNSEDVVITDAKKYVLFAETPETGMVVSHANNTFLALASIRLQGLAMRALDSARKED